MRRRAVLVLLFLLPLGLAAPPAAAAPPRSTAEVSVLPTARLAEDGASITVRLRVLCRPDATIQWEGFVSASQGDVLGWGQPALTCDGRRHVVDVVLPVSAEPGTASFRRGTATVTAWMVDENTLTEYARDVRTVAVRGGHHPHPCR